jgi:putative transposase
VQPATLIRWHRQGFWVFWRWKSRSGRPPIPVDLQALIRRMARENPSWGEKRIANELLLKLGLRVPPRTVRKYLPRSHDCRPTPGVSTQRWRTFVRNHAKVIVACDFCAVVTATFRNLYVFVVMQHATRTILHANVTVHPTAAWTLQQLRVAIPADHAYRFLLHDWDRIFSGELDQHVQHLGLRVLKTPVRSPQANALCERLLGTLRRECVDCLIPLTEHYLQHLLHAWVRHYNAGRPYMALGPGHSTATLIPTGAAARPPAPASDTVACAGLLNPGRLAPCIPAGSEGSLTMTTRGVAHHKPMSRGGRHG